MIESRSVNPLLAELGVTSRRPAVNPLKDLPVTGNAEVDAAVEVRHIENLIREKERRETQRREEVEDVEFYAVLVFEHKSQREAFLSAFDAEASSDGFINGLRLAERLGVPVGGTPLQDRSRGVDRDYARLVKGNDK